MATVEFGFKNIELIPYSDSSFTLDTGNKVTITRTMLMADTPIEVEMADNVTKRVFADGSIFTMTDVNDTPGQVRFTIGKTGWQGAANTMDDIILKLFPEAYKLTNGSLESIAYTKPIASDRSSWEKALLCRLTDPVNTTTQSEWVQARVAVNTTLTKMYGVDNSKFNVVLDCIGGETLSNGETIIIRDGDPDSGITIA